MLRPIGSMMAAILLVMSVLPGLASATEVHGAPPPAIVERSLPQPDGGGEVTPQNGALIRAILLGASALWRTPWFQNTIVAAVRRFGSSAAAQAVINSWYALGRAVDSLVMQETLTWTVVRESMLRTLMNQGYSRQVAESGALGLQEAFKLLSRMFN